MDGELFRIGLAIATLDNFGIRERAKELINDEATSGSDLESAKRIFDQDPKEINILSRMSSRFEGMCLDAIRQEYGIRADDTGHDSEGALIANVFIKEDALKEIVSHYKRNGNRSVILYGTDKIPSSVDACKKYLHPCDGLYFIEFFDILERFMVGKEDLR